jgi:2-phosphosulfolactate phosphatase
MEDGVNEKPTMIQLDWGVDGVRFALKKNDIVVIVDALRFSTAVTTAVANEFTIYPVADQIKGRALAATLGAEMSGKPGEARYTISPHSYLDVPPGSIRKVVLYSPNGATCAALVGGEDIVYIGCFLNARAVGRLLSKAALEEQRNITVVAAGEQRAIDSGERIVYDRAAAYPVFAIEDYLACGAIISHTEFPRSAEADLCAITFNAARERIEDLLAGSFSGRYLIENDLREDITHALRHDLYDVVPVVREGRIIGLGSK